MKNTPSDVEDNRRKPSSLCSMTFEKFPIIEEFHASNHRVWMRFTRRNDEIRPHPAFDLPCAETALLTIGL
ncbi:hypothetical protein RSAG8_04324, partial [Rhizoctonia solani AG-8 WAC10335]